MITSIQDTTEEHHNTTNENDSAIDLTQHQLSINTKDTFLTNESSMLQHRNIAVVTDDTSLSTLPNVKLSDGTLVTDYTEDKDFVARLEIMSYKEAENLSSQIRQHRNEFPMPFMAITAKKIHESINKLLKQHLLTSEEQKDFLQLQQELTALAPLYPYEQSLIFVYKFLLCKSFIEYKFQMESFNKYQPNSKNTNKFLCKDIIGINRISNFIDDCSLKDILNLPWQDMLKIENTFGAALVKQYKSFAMKDQNYNDGNIDRYPFSLDVAFIPYPEELKIANINKTWALPAIWLVGCSLDEVANADGFGLSSSSFFDHDLYHLGIKIKHSDTQEIYPEIFNWIKNIYQNKSIIDSISTIKFLAVELAIFLIGHEDASISKYSNIQQALINVANNTALSGLDDLPIEYAKISYDDIRKAAKWLTFLPTVGYTNKEFTQATLELKAKTSYIDFSNIQLFNSLHTVRTTHILPQIINKIIEDVKYNTLEIEQQKLSSSCIIANLRSYHKKHRFDRKDSLYPEFIDKNIFLENAFFTNEAQFTIEKYGNLIFK